MPSDPVPDDAQAEAAREQRLVDVEVLRTRSAWASECSRRLEERVRAVLQP